MRIMKAIFTNLFLAAAISVSVAAASEKDMPPLPDVYTSANRDTGLPYLAVRCAGYFGAVLDRNDENYSDIFKDMLGTRIADLIEYAIPIRTFGMSDSAVITETEKIHQEVIGFVDAYKEILTENLRLFGKRVPDGSDVAHDQELCVSFSASL